MTIKKIISSYLLKKRNNLHKSAVARKWAAALLFSTYFFYFQTISAKELKNTRGYIYCDENSPFFVSTGQRCFV